MFFFVSYIFQSECGTSMELHTPHSTEKSAPLSVDWISRHSSFDNGSSDPSGKNKPTHNDPIPDENESRGSPAGSPKSFDSHSSIEDKVIFLFKSLNKLAHFNIIKRFFTVNLLKAELRIQ